MTGSDAMGSRPSKLHDLFLASSARWGNRPALLLGSRQWTYSEVDHLARLIAAQIASSSDAPSRVGIYARRSLPAYAAVLGASLSGAAFVPLNPTLPAARLAAIAGAAELSVVVTEPHLLDELKLLLGRNPKGPPAIVVVDELSARVEQRHAHSIGSEGDCGSKETNGKDDTAYILFTSGSTGSPKGVPISHANVLSFLATNLARYVPTPDDVFSQTFEQSFDLSIFDIFMAWASGSALCVFTSADLLAPLRIVQSRQITVWFSVPSVVAVQLKLGLLKPKSAPSLRLSLFCGEPLPLEYAEAWHRAAPASVIENLYGPTELTIACSAYRWDSAKSAEACYNGVVSIGRPYPTLCSRIVDDEFRDVPPNQIGELLVGGPQTFSGYWRNPEATAAAFVELPNGEGTRVRFYRTGDLVRRSLNGDIAFVGRRDNQVKLGGHRIELGEIETALRSIPGVVEGVAYAWPLGAARAEAIVAAVSGADVDPDAIKTQLRTVLPAYMVPRTIWSIDSMPRNTSGKLDRRMLASHLQELAGGSSRGVVDAD